MFDTLMFFKTYFKVYIEIYILNPNCRIIAFILDATNIGKFLVEVPLALGGSEIG